MNSGNQSLGDGAQRRSRRGQVDIARVPVEQAFADGILERLHRPAQGRLRHRHAARGLAEAAGGSDAEEHGELLRDDIDAHRA